MAKLNGWHFPEEGPGYRLFGTVEGHPRLEDGMHIFTSPVIGRIGDIIVTESGTHYQLGAPLGCNTNGEKILDHLAGQYARRYLNSIPEVSVPSLPPA